MTTVSEKIKQLNSAVENRQNSYDKEYKMLDNTMGKRATIDNTVGSDIAAYNELKNSGAKESKIDIDELLYKSAAQEFAKEAEFADGGIISHECALNNFLDEYGRIVAKNGRVSSVANKNKEVSVIATIKSIYESIMKATPVMEGYESFAKSNDMTKTAAGLDALIGLVNRKGIDEKIQKSLKDSELVRYATNAKKVFGIYGFALDPEEIREYIAQGFKKLVCDSGLVDRLAAIASN